MFLKYAYRPVLTTDTRKNQYARAFYQVYSGVLAKDINCLLYTSPSPRDV